MKNQEARIRRLEDAARANDPETPLIILDPGGDFVTVDGVQLLRPDFERLYPDRRNWRTVELGVDLDLL